MALIYTSVEQRFNKIYFRGYKDGKRVQTNDALHKPTLYVPGQSIDYKSLFGESLTEIQFGDIREARDYIKSYSDVMKIHGNDRYEYDFIHRNFKGELNVDLGDLSVLYLDIETTTGQGAIDTRNAPETVLLISCYSNRQAKMVTFGVKPSNAKGTEYIQCTDEKDLLLKWINYCIEVDFDIMTGWNVVQFDMAYLGSRIIKLLGQRALDRLSPFGHIDMKTDTIMDREYLRYEISGRAVLDMLDLYRKFRFINRPNFRLGYIGEVEIGETKTENKYKSFRDHYESGWDDTEAGPDGFVSYNIQDVNLLVKLEEKLGLIYLAVTLAYLTKVNYSDVFSPVKTWESYILSTLYEENTFCRLKTIDRSSDNSIVGGFVKDVVPGMYKWTVGYDAASMYPSIIMANNMSPETIVDMIDVPSIDDMLSGKTPEIDPLYSLCANGARFRKDKQGVMPRLTSHVFESRKATKRKMLDLKQEYEKTHDEKYKLESVRYGVLQLALKVKVNSLFGVCSNKYFLFFDNRIAEGITMTGQYIIQTIANRLNEYMNSLVGDSSNKIVAMDTDSAYVHFGPLIEKYFSKITDEQKITDAIIKISSQKFDPILNETTNKIAHDLNMYENKIYFKLEAISSNSVFLAKKRNCQKVIDNEGVRYAEPDYKITGIETNRSSTPDLVRGWLVEAIKLILDHADRDILLKYIDECHKNFHSYSVEEIAFPRSSNNMKEYSDSKSIYAKGCPIAVRAALLYNHLIDKYDLGKKYELIKEGDKIKYVALTEPNTLRENIIGFPDKLPEEFNLHRYIDYETQFSKAFLDPLIKIMDTLNWKLEEENSLDSFF